MNIDRFSIPLDSERVHPFHLQQAIEEQRELNKKDIIDTYISRFYDSHGYTPGAEEIQERLYQLDIDQDTIKDRLKRF